MKSNWLWDRKIGLAQAKKILKNPKHKKFVLVTSLLLARNNEPHEVFTKFIDPLLFCKHWAAVKRSMRHDKWNQQRIVFWQAIYESLLRRYQKQGITFRKEVVLPEGSICQIIGRQIQNARKEQGLSQKDVAKKMRVSQQLISRIEKGGENISILTLNNISKALGKRIEVSLR